MAKQRFGEYLLRRGVISAEELKNALSEQRKSKEVLGQLLCRMGLLSAEELYPLLAEFYGLEYLPLTDFLPVAALGELVPHNVARKQSIVPVVLEGNTLVVAASSPLSSLVADNLRRITGRQVRTVLMAPEELAAAMAYLYEGVVPLSATTAAPEITVVAEGAAVAVELLTALLKKAVDMGASDIHIEPYPEYLRIRLRIDGTLRVVDLLPPGLAGMLVSRLKIMANLNIAERRAAQDGRLKFQHDDGDVLSVSARISTVPGIFGEKAVLRMQASGIILSLENLGLEPNQLVAVRKVLTQSPGIFLTTGPSGSGKTTTLYAALQHLRSEETNIITIEDPVEQILKGITQMQVNQKNTFQQALRFMLRQDPDIIMVGEIRDGETARLALQAALTGHLVLSTLHTNDATSAVFRLIDMGCETFLVNATVRAVLAQRLVRLLCPACRYQYTPSPDELEVLGLEPRSKEIFYNSQGCSACDGTKYKGRTGLYELLVIDAGFKKLVAQRADPVTLREYAPQHKMHTIRDSGMIKVRQGLTSVAEVLRATTEE